MAEQVDVLRGLVLRRVQQRQRHLMFLQHRQRLTTLRDEADPFTTPETTFAGLYRLPKHLVRDLVEQLGPHVNPVERSSGVPLEIKVLCALNFYAHGSYQKGVGGHHHLNLSQPTVSKAINTVTMALNNRAVATQWVKFPESADEQRRLIEMNFQQFKLPGVLGYVDGTHIAVVSPKVHEEAYVNRKGWHSLNVQIVCDSQYLILNVLARYPGSTHDSYVWRNSAVRTKMIGNYRNGRQSWLLGDSGYPHEPWLQLPIINAAEGTPDAEYTRRHLQARCTVERTIGILKNRFRCLLKHRVLHYEPGKAGLIVNACVVLHNMCLMRGVPVPEEPIDDEAGHPVGCGFQQQKGEVLNEARIVRRTIINRLPL